MRKLSLILIFSLLDAVSALAEVNGGCKQIRAAYLPAFTKILNSTYRPLMCSDNILAFRQELVAEAVDISAAKVILLRHKAAPYLPLIPAAARHPAKWSFHVFVVHQGLVFDFDHVNDDGLTPARGLREYLALMWGGGRLDQAIFQVKSLSLYSKRDLFGEFKDEAAFPAASLLPAFDPSLCIDESLGESSIPLN